jgi:hypothetical protein
MPSIAGDNDGLAGLPFPSEHDEPRQSRTAGAVPASPLFGEQYLPGIRRIEESLGQADAPIRLLRKFGACRCELTAKHV